jgi:hypothetical protein
MVKGNKSLFMVQVSGDINMSDINIGELLKALSGKKGNHDCPDEDHSG